MPRLNRCSLSAMGFLKNRATLHAQVLGVWLMSGILIRWPWSASSKAFVLVQGRTRGAGGNRTPVHQPVNELATTIPGVDTDAVSPTGRLSARGGPRAVFPTSQRSFSPSAVFPAVIPHFCCRAVMDWPRATFLLTMTLRSLDVNQAARANCSSAILVVAPFSESEQLGSQTRTALLTSKPVSPVIDMWLSAAKSSLPTMAGYRTVGRAVGPTPGGSSFLRPFDRRWHL